MTVRDMARLFLVAMLLVGTVAAAGGVAETAPTEAVDVAPEAPVDADADGTEAGRSGPSPRAPLAAGAREATALDAAWCAGGGAPPTPPPQA